MAKSKASSAVAGFSESEYFTVDDVARGFALVVDSGRAIAFSKIFEKTFADSIAEGRIVAFPDGYRLPRLGAPPGACEPSRHFAGEEDFETVQEQRLIRFTDLLLALVAAANPEVRKRFDRLGLRYGSKTIDDPVAWQRTLSFLRAE